VFEYNHKPDCIFGVQLGRLYSEVMLSDGTFGRPRVPKLRRQTFETAIIERYRRRESSVEEALIEMYLASVRRVEDITEALWGTRPRRCRT
jgi:transposase-like protein